MVSLTGLLGKKAATTVTTKATTTATTVTGKATESATTAAEVAALKKAGATTSQVAAFQALEAGAGGSKALTSDLTSGARTISSTLNSIPSWLYGGLTFAKGATTSQLGVALFIYFIIFCCILYFLYFLYNKMYPPKPAVTATVQNTKASKTVNVLNAVTSNAPAAVEGFVDTVSPDEYTLVNIQPLTIKQAGFLGPIQAGVFDDTAAANALRGGFRSLIFQIDFMDVQKDGFPAPSIPTLVYRGDDGSLLSKNSADINAVAQSIANSAFRPEVPNYTEPVIIYLHILRAPSAINAADEYKRFLSRIASSLNPLAPYHLGMTPLGTFNRQKQESILVNSPLKSFQGQVIIMCNADTSIFRQGKVNPADDLDFWVNIRVYLHSNEVLGITQMPPSGVTPSAIVTKMSTLLSLPVQTADAFASAAKSQIVICLPSQMHNPTNKELDILLHKLGVNIVPIDIFSETVKEIQPLLAEYNNMTFSPKLSGLRNTQ
jgi:hypothetical protein